MVLLRLILLGQVISLVIGSLVLEVEEAHNMNFKHVGDLDGSVVFAHIAMTVNVIKHIDLVREMCYLPRVLASSNTEDKKTAQLASALHTHCQLLFEALGEQFQIWWNTYKKNQKSGRQSRREVEITEKVNDSFDPFRFHQMSRAPKVRVR
jgi:hypothetical protein